MRISNVVRSVFLFLALTSPTFLFAQFQPPTPEELKMTADPKAPGAAAVYLNVEEVANDPIHFQTFYARIKVLQEKGKELATVEVPYARGNYKIEDIKGRTIHPDGTIIPLVGKPEDLLISKKGDQQYDRKVFTLPSVEVGSILEYRYDLRYDDNHYSSPSWEIQRPYFVHSARYSFIPFKGFLPGAQNETSMYLTNSRGEVLNSLLWWTVLPPGMQVKSDVAGRHSLELTDIPPSPAEEWMPPIQPLLYQVNFYYKSSSNMTEFWTNEAKRWSKEVDHFAEPSKAIREAVTGLIAPSDDEMAKAKKLYVAVQALDNTDFSRKKGESELKQLNLKVAKRAENTWSMKSGTKEDIALLYLALVRAAGLTAYDLKVVNRDLGAFNPGYMFIGQLDDDIIILSIAGKEFAVDPGEKMCPFQTVHWKHSGAMGLRQSTDGQSAANSPAQDYRTNTLLRMGDLTLDGHGTIKGELRFTMAGQEALRWRQTALQNDLDEVKKSFDRWLEQMMPDGVEAHVDNFQAMDQPDAKLVALINVKGTLGTATAKRIMLPGFFFHTRGRPPFVDQEKRFVPVDMQYGELVTDQVTYHLPGGLSVEGFPPDSAIPWAQHANFITKTVTGSDKITIVRSLARAFSILKSEEYQDLRGFYQKIAASDQQQLVLTVAPETKGN
jgi:hypothetical protein